MSTTALTGIGLLVTHDAELGEIRDAALVIDEDRIVWIGASADVPDADDGTDLDGRCVIPGFVDSHTHVIFAGDRAPEFEARMSGQPYTAGGIHSTVAATRAASDDELTGHAAGLIAEMLAAGTTTTEIKTGYGLSTVDEQRSAQVAARLSDDVTFLGAHVVPAEYADRPDDYVALVSGPMLDACAPYCRWIDVFCDRGAFDVDQARTILAAGSARGLGLRVHANQFGHGAGVQLAVELGAASADHCTHLSDTDVEALAGSTTVATLLPGAEFSTRSPYPDARRLIDAGATVALATDCNPGSSYTSNMAFCIALAVREMNMTPAEALWAATAGGARALRRDDVGVIALGSRADLVALQATSPVHLAYRPGVPLIAATWKGGQPITA
ncbi:MAG: imidazolonepropionase [Geodermatophilaceae bacterium]|nr:imidazolonepropionase [Geodermatophilaceae bacterium]MDQ3464624.1 imidazolonepropionase [Actinomycetota bacterium]